MKTWAIDVRALGATTTNGEAGRSAMLIKKREGRQEIEEIEDLTRKKLSPARELSPMMKKKKITMGRERKKFCTQKEEVCFAAGAETSVEIP